MYRLLIVLVTYAAGHGLLHAQNVDDYRSAATGTWQTTSTWERYSGSTWDPAVAAPDSNAGLITVQAGHTVTVDADLGVDSVNVLPGGVLVIDASATVTVPFNNDGMGIDVDSLGMLEVNGTIVCQGLVSGSESSITFNDGSLYDHARNEGSVPRSLWATGSTMRLSGVSSTTPDNMSQDFYNLVIVFLQALE